MPKPTDILVLFALKEEFVSVLQEIGISPKAETIAGVPCYPFTLPDAGGISRLGFATFVGAMDQPHMQGLAQHLVYSHPFRLVCLLGISGQMSNDACLGDVVVPSAIDLFLSGGKVTGDGSGDLPTFADLRLSGDVLPCGWSTTHPLEHLSIGFPSEFADWQRSSRERIQRTLERKELQPLVEARLVRADALPDLKVGPFASGSLVGATLGFKDWLRGRNRKYIALDMESYGFLNAVRYKPDAPATLVIRAISDPADERKKEVDALGNKGDAIRHWAMTNAFSLLRLYHRTAFAYPPSTATMVSVPDGRPTLDTLESNIHARTLSTLLPSTYRSLVNAHDTDSVLTKYSALYEILAGHAAPSAPQPRAWLLDLARQIATSPSRLPLVVAGPAGTGKSGLLSLLYVALQKQSKDGTHNRLPIYVDLHRYNLLIYSGKTAAELREDAERTCQNDLDVLWAIAREYPGRELILLIDGLDDSLPLKLDVRRYLFKRLLDLPNPIHFVVAGTVARPEDALELKEVAQKPEQRIFLDYIQVASPQFAPFVEIFAAVNQPAQRRFAQSLRQLVHAYSLRHVDVFILGLLTSSRLSGSRTLVELFRRYCLETLGSSSEDLDLTSTASLAFRHWFRLESFDRETLLRAGAKWQLVHAHSTVRDFLLASHALAELLSGDTKRGEQALHYVHPYGVNIFLKEMINDAPEASVTALQNVAAQADDLAALTNCSYLLGRFTGEPAKTRAAKILNELRERRGLSQQPNAKSKPSVGGRSKADRRKLLFQRAVLVSLSYLGDTRAAIEYVEQLIANKDREALNRGFHLQYYGDAPLERGETAMLSADGPPFVPWPLTYRHLVERLRGTTGREPHDPMRNIEVFTLASMALHRHVAGCLEKESRTEVMDLLEQTLGRFPAPSGELGKYLRFALRALKEEHFGAGVVLEELYRVKDTKRSGWNRTRPRREVPNPESVGDHTLGTQLIGELFLPAAWRGREGKGSKERVLRMLLIHDLAEAWTGDIPHDLKTEKQVAEEAAVFEYLGQVNALAAVPEGKEIEKLFEEFLHGRTEDACVARDIDRLENLVQLYIYAAREKCVIEDSDDWRRQLSAEIRTGIGERIRDLLIEHFERRVDASGSNPTAC